MLDFIYLAASGVVIGLIVAVPIGPVNLICIRRTLAFGPVNGFVSGLGAAVGDTVFAIVTGFGLTVVAQWIKGYTSLLELVGGGMLVFFGIHTFYAKVQPRIPDSVANRENGASSLARAIASTFALTITNPATLLGFTALFAGLGGLAGGHPSFLSAAVVVAGVAAGSTLWWLVLTTIIGLLHHSIDDRTMLYINKGSGFAVFGFGAAVLINLAQKFL
ncbi:MAG: LysE family transporter [Proteobacteria bacterium]|nr:LysE family transporter [Pseudomonadota bacterium]